MTQNELKLRLGVDSNAKSLNEILLARMLDVKGRIACTEEFQKAGIIPKTIRVQSNGKIKESMSFPTFDFIALSKEETWEESELYNYLAPTKFMFVIFQERGAGAYVESWIDELEYADISTVSRNQRVYLYNAGVMMNGRIYSVDVTPQRVEATPLKDILETGPVDEHYFLRTEDMPRWTYSKGAKREKRQRQDGRQYYFSEGSVQFPESLEKPSRTMLTSESQVGRTSHVIQDPMTGRLRVLTPIECERLNGFPADWTDTGMPERMRYFCMGNALVVPLVKRIGDALLNAGI